MFPSTNHKKSLYVHTIIPPSGPSASKNQSCQAGLPEAASPRGLFPTTFGHGWRRRALEQRDARGLAPGSDGVSHGDLTDFMFVWGYPTGLTSAIVNSLVKW